MSSSQFSIRSLHCLAELRACVELQKSIWDCEDSELVPEHIFVIAGKTGGQVLGAFDGITLIGFALAFPALDQDRIYLHSHMVAISREYQNQGLATQLKLTQREDALRRNIDRIEWTFDPLQIRNAYFNVSRLGAIVHQYVPNLYGITSSPLHGGIGTDRLAAQWHLRSSRVLLALTKSLRVAADVCDRISVPLEIAGICRNEPMRAAQIQRELRNAFEQSFDRGYAVLGFEVTHECGTYLLGPYED